MHPPDDDRDAVDAQTPLPAPQQQPQAAEGRPFLAGSAAVLTNAGAMVQQAEEAAQTSEDADAARQSSEGDQENDVDEADYLKRRSKCQKAADVLIEELTEHKLLRDTMNWQGTTKSSTYADYRLRHRDIAPGHLLGLMKNATLGGSPTAKGVASMINAKSSSTPRGSTPRGSTPRGSTPRGSTPRGASSKSSALGFIGSKSLLMKSRLANQRLSLPADERKALAKEIVNQLFALRNNLRTQKVVERVVHKYERLREYTQAARIEDLPEAVRNEIMMVQGLTQQADNLTSLAADVRALRQLMQLKQEQRAIDSKMHAMMQKANRTALFQTRARTGQNQMSLLQRRQVLPESAGTLPSPFVYSRMRRLKTLDGHLQIRAFCLTYDKTGKFVITGADDRLVKIWSLATGDLLFTLRGHVGNITDLAVNNSNTLLASSSDDKTVRIWELSTGAPVAVLLGHSNVVNAVRFHPTKNVVVTASNDGRCFCYTLPEIPWRTNTSEPETKLQTAQRLNASKAYLLSLHPVFSLTHGTLRTGVRSCKVLCLSFSRCGKYVITGSQDGVGRVWDVSIFSGSDAPVSTSQYQHEGELQINLDAIQTAVVAVAQPAEAGVAQANPDPVAAADQVILPLEPLEPTPAPQGAEVPVPALLPVGTVVQTPGDGTPRGLAPPLPLPVDVVEELAPAAAQRQQTQLPQLPQNGVVALESIADVDIPSLPTKEPIALLQGHTGPITNIVYSNDGKLIATASIKDGTTRIWQWDKKHKKLHHKVLLADEPDENEQLASLYGVQTRKKAAPAVDTLSWSRDDRRLITLHSVKPDSHEPDADWKQRVRVWDPLTGKLVMTLAAVDKEKQNGHTNAVFVMDVHPTDWRIVVTAGYDGRIFLWDISTGKMLKSFINMSPDLELVPMLDGGFIPNGNGFCFTDRIGRLLIFGTGSGEQYAATPVQQYFQSDYAALITDRNFNVLDRETQQIPSMMEPGPLVDIYQIEYPHQPPHVIMRGGVNNFTPEQYEENRRLRIQQAIESEIKCRVHHAQDDRSECEEFPSVIYSPRSFLSSDRLGGRGDNALLATSSYRLNGAPVAISELRRRHNASARRRSNNSLEERDTSILNIEISSEDDHSDEDFQAPTGSRNNGDDEDEDEDEDDDDDDDDDDDEDEDEDEDEDDLLSDRGDDEESPHFHRRRRARAAASQSSATGRAAVFPRRGGRRLQESPRDDEAGGDESDDGEGRVLPRRRTRRNSITVNARRRRVVESDEESDASNDNRRNRNDHNTTDGDQETRRSPYFDGRGRDNSIDDQGEVVVETNDGFIMGDNQLDKFDRTITYEQLLESKRLQLGTTRDNAATENGDEALIPCAFCHGGDDGGVLKLPGDSMGVNPLINGAQRLFVHDQCAIASPLCFNRGGKWYNVTKEIRRGRSLICVGCKKRGATVGCTVTSCPKSYHWKCAIGCGWSMNQIAFYCPSHESMRSEEERKEQGGDEDSDPVTKRFGHTFHRDWLQKLSLASTQSYVPQVGDYVTYFPQGHKTYLRLFPVRELTFITRFRKFFALKCRVVDVRYVFPTLSEYANCSSIKCEISLAVLAAPSAAFEDRTTGSNENEEEETKADEDSSGSANLLVDSDSSPFASFTGVDAHLQPANDVVASERFGFQFMYHPHDVSNFLVLDHEYEKGVRGNWQIGERVEMPIVELDEHGSETPAGFTYGTITGLIPKFIDSERQILSPWECVQVDWEDKEMDGTNVSPWEIEPVAGTPRRMEKRQRDFERRATMLFRSRSITGGKRAVLLQEIDTIMNLSISRDFLYPVDSSFLDYVLMVANPIDLTKIQLRVRNGYYRQVEAFIADAQLLYINCETYNVPTSSIAQNSRSIYSALLSQVLRHFPSLLRGENWDPQGDCRVFTYPPNDFVDGFPDDDNIDNADDAAMVAPPPPPPAASAALRSRAGPGVPAAQSAAESPRARASSAQSSPVRRINRSAASAAAAAAAVARATEEETKADGEHVPSNTTRGRPRSKSDEVKAVLSNISKQLNSPSSTERIPRAVAKSQQDSALSPARGPHVRTTSTNSNDTPGRAAKRRRQLPRAPAAATSLSAAIAGVDGLMDYDDLLEKLTIPQRELLEQQCEEDLQLVLRDFHEALSQLDENDIFAVPVTEQVAPNYFSIISHPMDFGTMMDKIDDYQDFAEYFEDLYLTLSNAITYNTWEGFIGDVVKELQEHFVKFLLDAIGGGKPEPTRKGKPQQVTSSSSKTQKAKLKAPAKRKAKVMSRRNAVSDDEEEEESYNSDSDSAEQDDDEDEDDDDEVSTGDESDWSGTAGKRKKQQLSRSPAKLKRRRS